MSFGSHASDRGCRGRTFLLAVHLDELAALPRRGRRAEEKRPRAFQSFSNDALPGTRPCFQPVGIQRCDTRIEMERATRPSPSSGCQWFIRWWTKSKPNRTSSGPLRPGRVGVERATGRCGREVPAFGIPEVGKPEMKIGGMPLSRGSGPLVPGCQHFRAKVGAEVRGSTSCPNLVQPNVPSITRVGDRQVCPMPAICTSVEPSPRPPRETRASRLPRLVAVDQRIHRAVLEPDLVIGIAVPVHLRVEVAAVQALNPGVEVVVVVPGLVGASARAPAASSSVRSTATAE